MDRSRRIRLVDVAVVFSIIVVVAAVLVPVLAFSRDPQTSQCQSNLVSMGRAIKMYLSDWEDVFPTNRVISRKQGDKATLTNAVTCVKLSDPAYVDQFGNPVRFQYGIGWVEALYPYVERITGGRDPSVWRCPEVKSLKGNEASRSACVTYALNFNLIEQAEGRIMWAGNTMMVREMDRLHDSVLRPTSSSPSEAYPPKDPFLDAAETGCKKARYKLHGSGSHILFTDGHVKLFGSDYYSDPCEWDLETGQWCNYVSLRQGDLRNRSIIVSLAADKKR